MSSLLIYTAKDFADISQGGFEYQLEQEAIDTINRLAKSIGLVQRVSSNIFIKREAAILSKKRGRAKEASEDDWTKNASITTSSSSFDKKPFEKTIINKKTGIELERDQIRLNFNKLTDKTFLDIREKIILQLDNLQCQNYLDIPENVVNVATDIYNISSSNRFYSKIFADLYAELVSKYDWLNATFQKQLENAMMTYSTIKYVNPDEDYDEYCKNNLLIDKRRANTTFLLNLAKNGCIKKTVAISVLHQLLQMIVKLIREEGNKNLVDELVENIAILADKQFIEEVEDEADYNEDEYLIDELSVSDTIRLISTYKTKDFVSLTSKTVFKFMDLI